MKTKIEFVAPFFIVLLISSACNYESRSFFHNVGVDHYYPSEIFKDNYKEIYGDWRLSAVSGKISTDHVPEFERIVIEKIGMFKVFRNDTLLGFGKINIHEDNYHSLQISFSPDRGLKSISFYKTNKNLYLKEDHLNLYASCCDQYNYHFIRRR